MANNGREYKRERPFGQEADKPGNSDESKYGDHPILGNDKQSLANEFLRPPSRSGADPMTRPPELPAGSKVIPIRGPSQQGPHDPDVDYQPPIR